MKYITVCKIQAMSFLPIVLAAVFPVAPHGDNFLMPLAINAAGIINLFILIRLVAADMHGDRGIRKISIPVAVIVLMINLILFISSDFLLFVMGLSF